MKPGPDEKVTFNKDFWKPIHNKGRSGSNYPVPSNMQKVVDNYRERLSNLVSQGSPNRSVVG